MERGKTMNRNTVLLVALFLIPALSAWADNNRDGGRENNNNAKSGRATAAARAPQARQPVVINMSHGSSGGHNRNFPAQQPSRPAAQPQVSHQPSYGQLHWTAPSQNRTQPQPWTPAANNVRRGVPGVNPRPTLKAYSGTGVRAAVAVHHHAYTQGYVRKKLQKIGVTSEPNLITDRAEIIHTDRLHSTIGYPKFGPATLPYPPRLFLPGISTTRSCANKWPG